METRKQSLQNLQQYISKDPLPLYEPADIEIYIKDRGIVLNEKSLVALQPKNAPTKVIAVGNEVLEMNPIPNDTLFFSPLHQNCIVDFSVASKMFKYFFKKIMKQSPFLPGPRSISLCIPYHMDSIQLVTYQDLIYCSTKAREVKYIFQDFNEFLKTASEEEQNQHKIIINITKNAPVDYVREHVKESIQYAEHYGITKDQLIHMIQEL